MKKHFLKSFALIAMLFSALNLSAASGVDWSTITWIGSTDATYNEKFKCSTTEGLVNIQHPGFASEIGIYMTFPAAGIECNLTGISVQGAGVIMHLSSFTAQETEVTVTYAGGSRTFWVYYADGTATETPGEGGEEPEPTPEPEEPEVTDKWADVDWVAASDNKYKIYSECLTQVVSVQQPGWANEKGIYVTVPAGISECSVNGAIDGAGMILYLSSFTAKETEVTITHGLGSCTFWVYYADGTEGDGTDEGGEEPEPTPDPETPQPEGTNLFDPTNASIESTYLAPNWNLDPNSSATYDSATGTISVDLQSTFVGRWQAQVKFKHNVAFNAEKHYVFSAKFHSNIAVNGVLVKMDDNAIVFEDGTITLPADEDFVYTSTPQYGVAGNNQIMVFDFGYATPCQITITDISIREITPVVEEIEHPAAAPAPKLPAEQVFSIYSDTYTTTVTRVTGSWGQSTREEEIELTTGDKAFYYTNSNYLGWEFNGSTTIGDMTAYPKLHMDIYVAEAASIGFTPIWGSEAEKAYTLQAGWNALEIDLAADFVGINLANIYQIKWANMPATCYIDNVYFHKEVKVPTNVDNTLINTQLQKIIRNGQLVIIRNGVSYDVMGRIIR